MVDIDSVNFDDIEEALLYEGNSDNLEKLVGKLEDLLLVVKRRKRDLDRRDC